MSSLRQVPDLPGIIERHKLRVFIETGCGEGDGLRYAKELGLDPRISCDVNLDRVEQCQDLGSVYCINSIELLKCFNPHVPTLYWLDAHFPEHHGAHGLSPKLRWPLFEELQELQAKKRIAEAVIICDDMRVIQSIDNPTRNPNLDPYFKIKNVSIKDLADLFPEKQSTIYTVDTGILVMEPK